MNPNLFSRRRLLAGLIASVALVQTPAAAESHGLVLVTEKGSRSLGLVDPVTLEQIATIVEDGVTGHEVAASPDGRRAFVPIYGNAGVGQPGTDGRLMRVLDLRKREIVGTVDFGKGVRPHLPVYDPVKNLLYVTTELENAITVIDPKTLTIVGTVPTGQPESHMLVLSHDGRRGYTANVGPGTVSVLDLDARKLVKVIKVADTTQRISISPDDRFVVTADQLNPKLIVIDTAKDEVGGEIELPGVAYGTTFTPDGKTLLACLQRARKLAVIDVAARKVERTIDVPKFPQSVLVEPDGAMAFVTCDASEQLAAIDTATWSVKKLIHTGPGTDGIAWAPSVGR
ncbi:MAG TPA: cytochrome D1 domain-containing protein [Opitutus sp.]|nr:cytochrome D1 domain-containing protein [Opitutus sp.]